MNKDIILVGDRILIEPVTGDTLTDYGLYLPETVKEKEKVQSGRIVEIGPGYPVFDPSSLEEEPWAVSKTKGKYFPLQAKKRDYCLFLRDSAVEIEFEKKKYLVIQHSAVLLLIRNRVEDDLDSII